MNLSSLHPTKSKGFTLIEVLISVLILSVGLLGLVYLQTAVLRASWNSNSRSTTSQLAYSMTERIRVNANATQNGTSAYNFANSSHATQQAGCLPTGGICTEANRAQQDLYEWHKNITRLMPSGYGKIEATTSKTFIIQIYRNEGIAADNPLQMEFTL